jgi:hypothetical protein
LSALAAAAAAALAAAAIIPGTDSLNRRLTAPA